MAPCRSISKSQLPELGAINELGSCERKFYLAAVRRTFRALYEPQRCPESLAVHISLFKNEGGFFGGFNILAFSISKSG